VSALRRDLGRPGAVEQGVVDVVDLDLDVVLLAPLLRVRVVEPCVVRGDEMNPRHDPQITRELLVLEPERPVEAEGLVRQSAEHPYCKRGRGAPLQQVGSRQRGARALELVSRV
jgi:hypothetical protein